MFTIKSFILLALIVCIIAPPVQKNNESTNEEDHGDEWMQNLEYGRYLKEVVQALESDPEFRKKLESTDAEDIKSGKIARDLHFVDHNIRTKLDELKRQELERLRHLAIKEQEKKHGIDRSRLKIPTHVDHNNPTRFETEDLKKLILQLNDDLEVVDKKRKDEFKHYEMQKQYEYKHELEGMTEDKKKEAMNKHDDQEKKHKEHPKLHHPGSKKQFEEVWEEQDHMKSEDFDSNTFFHVHDLDGNNYWDENEVKALFQKELDKMYDPNASEDDQTERYEEMERMREHVFRESDTNQDNLISFDEFMEQTKKQEFDRDEGWQGLDEQEELFSQQDYDTYEHERQAEIQHLIDTGAIPPPPGYNGLQPPQPHPMDNQIDSQGYHASPQGYQGGPQGYQGGPQGYQGGPQGYQGGPQGYQGGPQGYQGGPQGYQGAPPQGYQGGPQGYQGAPHQGNQGAPPQGNQGAPPQGNQGAPPQGNQGAPQGNQGAPQGNQGAPPQGYQGAPPQAYQGAPPQGNQQVPPQGYQQGNQAVPKTQDQPAVPIPQVQQTAHQDQKIVPQRQDSLKPPAAVVKESLPKPQDKINQAPQPKAPVPVPEAQANINNKPQPISHDQKLPGAA